MTPEEKAIELILKFMRLQEPNYNWFHSKLAKECALIAVDEILSTIQDLKCEDVNWDYWIEVKKESDVL